MPHDPPHDPPLDYASPKIRQAATSRPLRVWMMLLLVWAVGLVVWTVYIVAIGYLALRFL